MISLDNNLTLREGFKKKNYFLGIFHNFHDFLTEIVRNLKSVTNGLNHEKIIANLPPL